jgi:hypothetical protein
VATARGGKLCRRVRLRWRSRSRQAAADGRDRHAPRRSRRADQRQPAQRRSIGDSRRDSQAAPVGRGHRRSRLRSAQPFSSAHPADVILLAGKGHEPYQEIAGVRRPFSDLTAGTSRARCASGGGRMSVVMMEAAQAIAAHADRRKTAWRPSSSRRVDRQPQDRSRRTLHRPARRELRRPRIPRHRKARGAVAAVVAADAVASLRKSRSAAAGRRRYAPGARCLAAAWRSPLRPAADRRHRQQRQDDEQGNDRQHPARGARRCVLATQGNSTTTSACR